MKKPKHRPKPSKSRIKSRYRPHVLANILRGALRKVFFHPDILSQIFQVTPLEDSADYTFPLDGTSVVCRESSMEDGDPNDNLPCISEGGE